MEEKLAGHLPLLDQTQFTLWLAVVDQMAQLRRLDQAHMVVAALTALITEV
jgi:hypothetical protein